MIDQIARILGIIIGVLLIAIPIALQLRKSFMDAFGDKLKAFGLLATEAKKESSDTNKRLTELERFVKTQENFITNLEQDVSRLEADNANQKLKLEEYEDALEVTLQELKVTQIQLQAVIGQNMEILDGLDYIAQEVDKLRVEMGPDAEKLAGVDNAITSLKNKAGNISRARKSTGPLKNEPASPIDKDDLVR